MSRSQRIVCQRFYFAFFAKTQRSLQLRNHFFCTLIQGGSDSGRKSIKKPLSLLKGSFKVGDDLLSHVCSTIGAGRLNFSVRNGKRWNPAAIVTLRSFRSLEFEVCIVLLPPSAFRLPPFNIMTYRKKVNKTVPLKRTGN